MPLGAIIRTAIYTISLLLLCWWHNKILKYYEIVALLFLALKIFFYSIYYNMEKYEFQCIFIIFDKFLFLFSILSNFLVVEKFLFYENFFGSLIFFCKWIDKTDMIAFIIGFFVFFENIFLLNRMRIYDWNS